MERPQRPWYALEAPGSIPSPSLLVYPERIRHNIREMIRIAGHPGRLRPHVKTHKTAEIIQLQQAAGINRFKCATIAEAELLGQCKAEDVLMAYQPVGPDQGRILQLQKEFPNTRYSALVDCEPVLDQLGALTAQTGITLGIFLDLNVGMDRTGISPGSKAAELYSKIRTFPMLEARGLHAYDGHLRQTDFEERKVACDAAFAKVIELKTSLESDGIEIPAIIAGGSPTFPVHARRKDIELSPGTVLLWDARYGSNFPEMDFLPAAVLLSRVISHPADNIFCLDLGHKAIAPEMDFPRVALMGLESCRQTGQSEEHLVLRCPADSGLTVGQVIYGIPMHICPTVAKYPRLAVVEEGAVQNYWEVVARDYQLNF